jgi:xylulokinase
MSSDRLYLGIDVGTTSVKTVLTNEFGVPLDEASVEYPTISGSYDKSVEQRPDDWWKAAVKAAVSITTGQRCAFVEGISVCSQAPALLGVDKNNQPIGNAWIWMDRRSEDLCKKRLLPLEKEIVSYSGNRVDPYFTLPKILWQNQNLPKQAEQTQTYLQVNGWIIFRLTGICSIDDTHAVLSQLYNIDEGRWEIDFLDDVGIYHGKLPQIYRPWDIVGHLLPEPSHALGFREGIPVMAGSTDGAASALGLGLTATGQLFEMSGQSSGLGLIMDRPRRYPKLIQLKHAIEGKWILKGSMTSSGGSLKWFRDNLDERSEDTVAFSEYDFIADKVPAGANGVIFLPYLSGERAPVWDANAKGIFFGLSAQTTKADLIRAILEGTAYSLRGIMEEFPSDVQMNREIVGSGGGYKSALWTHIKADVLERPIHTIAGKFDAGAVGAAHIAIRGVTGKLPILNKETKVIFEPDPVHLASYARNYEIFRHLYGNNRNLFHII